MISAKNGYEGNEATVRLLLDSKADINLRGKVTRGNGWEGVARAGALYAMYTNLHAYSQIPRDNSLLAAS